MRIKNENTKLTKCVKAHEKEFFNLENKNENQGQTMLNPPKPPRFFLIATIGPQKNLKQGYQTLLRQLSLTQPHPRLSSPVPPRQAAPASLFTSMSNTSHKSFSDPTNLEKNLIIYLKVN